MPRIKLSIDKGELQKVINEVEATTTFTTRNDLSNAVADHPFCKNFKPKPITASVVLLRIKEFNLQVKTPVGQRGRQPGSGPVPRSTSPRKQSNLSELIKTIPLEFKSLADKLQNGSNSKNLLIKLKCLECCNWERKEVKVCNIKGCALHSIRPYK